MTIQMDSLPVLNVDNVALWNNGNFTCRIGNALFKGYESGFGLMLTITPTQASRSYEKIGVRYGHHRSGKFLHNEGPQKTRRGFCYEVINLKGIGRIKGDFTGMFNIVTDTSLIVVPWDREEEKIYHDSGYKEYVPSQTSVRGLLDFTDAHADAMWGEQLYALGVRTHRTVGIVGLKKLLTLEGVKSVETLKKKGSLPAGFTPVVQVRAFGTDLRVSDLRDASSEQKTEFLQTALKMLEFEFGKKMEIEEYLMWFARTLAKNMGLLHKSSIRHGSINPHNVTLDCRIVDHDSMVTDFPSSVPGFFDETFGGSIGRSAKEVMYHFFMWMDIPEETSAPIMRVFKEEYELYYPGV